jgi:broad-specificity NMP kinase
MTPRRRLDGDFHHAWRMAAALVLTGAPGTGKSSVLGALATRLELEGIAYGAIESEQLAWGSPWLPPEAEREQLAMVLDYQRRAGRDLLLVGVTAETEEDLAATVAATGAERAFVVCLDASPDTVARRLDEREPDVWPGKADLIARARDLAATIPALDGIDLVVSTEGREPHAVAGEIFEAWRLRRGRGDGPRSRP